MAMEFTRLADVPVIEEVKDDDFALIVQDGDVKRAPKSAIGGGTGGMGLDALISYKHIDGDETTTLLTGDYKKIMEKYQNMEPIFAAIHIVRKSQYSNYYHFYIFNNITVYDNGEIFLSEYDGYSGCTIYPDNTVSYYWMD